MTRPDSALMFAAGFGTRMAPLTQRMPKPLVQVAGKPLFDHALDLVRGAGIPNIVSNTHYRADAMARHLSLRGIVESHEPTIRDTGGGVKAALRFLSGEAIVTINTDAVWTGANPVSALLERWDAARMDALLVLIARDRATGHAGKGDFVFDQAGRLSYGPGLVYSGLQIIKTAPFAATAEETFSMHRTWRPMLTAGRVLGIVHDGGWCDVGRPESIALAENLLENSDV